MFYVFRVDTGTMVRMNINHAVETVAQLKDAIARTCNIPPEQQVLLVSGGESLDMSLRVCHYSGGTDTNPIFLFSKSSLANRSLSPVADFASDGEFTDRIEASLELPPTYNTVVTRATLAQSLCELGGELHRQCESLVHDQHLQQQGWAAAVANLEDMATYTNEYSLTFQKEYNMHLEIRDECLNTLHTFSQELQALARIPILPPLLAGAILSSGLEMTTKITCMTLLDWISAKGNQSSLEAVAEQCASFLEQCDASTLQGLVKQVDQALATAGNTEMKEIKGLSERFGGLEQMMLKAKRIFQDQMDFNTSFQNNQNRASNLKDASILPDLCASHKGQLLVMLENHSKLKDLRRRCKKAKEELSENLLHRLRWVAYAENEMRAVGNNLFIYLESLKRGRRHFTIVRQVQRAPEMYCLGVAEVVRRKKFSTAFLSWAADLSNRLLAAYNEEIERRNDFKLQFRGHFLEALFPGIDDEPPSFATVPPQPFDASLPELSVEDMEVLQETMPELALNISWTELSSVAQMVLSKAQIEVKDDSREGAPVEDRLVAAVTKVGLADKLDETLLRPDDINKFKDDREIESETDTEEFEKVSSCPFEKKLEKSSKEDLNRLFQLKVLESSRSAIEATSSLRSELSEFRDKSLTDRDSILGLVHQIQNHILQLTNSYVEELAATHSRLNTSQIEADIKLGQLKEVIAEQDILKLKNEEENCALRVELEKAKDELGHVQEQLNDLNQAFQVKNEENLALIDQIQVDKNKFEDIKRQMIIDKEKEVIEAVANTKNECEQLLSNKVEEYKTIITKKVEEERQFTVDAQSREEQIAQLKEKLVQAELTAAVETENRCKELELEYNKSVQELQARLTQEHRNELQQERDRLTSDFKTQIGSLRSRFRLMSITSMEKSPSDSSLEKIERGDVIELVNHEAILAQTKEDAEIAMEQAVAEAIKEQQQKNRANIEDQLQLAKARMEEEKQVWLEEAVTRALAERDRQAKEELEAAKEKLEQDQVAKISAAVALAVSEKDKHVENLIGRLQTLSTECQRHRDTIRRLTDGELVRSGSGTNHDLYNRLEHLEIEKKSLIDEVAKLRDQVKAKETVEALTVERETVGSTSDDLAQSVASLNLTESGYHDLATSPQSSQDIMARSLRDVGGKICMGSCAPNDAVLVVWNVDHANYVVLQDSPTIYFLHSGCLDMLGLRPSSDGSARTLYVPGIVVAKEYCQAKKHDNRYRVPKGTRFFRVVVKPMLRERQNMSSSRIATPPGTLLS